MKNLIPIFIITLLFSCSDDNDSNNNNNNNNNDSYIEVTIDGTYLYFNNIQFEEHFENPNDLYYYVTATIEGRNDLVIDFDVTIGYLNTSNSDQAIGEFSTYVYDDFTVFNFPECSYYGVDVYAPLLNVTVNTQTEFRATFEFNTEDVTTDIQSIDCMFGEYVDYTNGVIHLNL